MGRPTILQAIIQKYILSGSCQVTNIKYQTNNNIIKMTPLVIFTLVSLLSTAINSLPESASTSCSSQTCKDCLGSCDGCDACNLCKICPESVPICSKCKWCKNGIAKCKKDCHRGKSESVCKKCIEECTK